MSPYKFPTACADDLRHRPRRVVRESERIDETPINRSCGMAIAWNPRQSVDAATTEALEARATDASGAIP